MLNGTQFAPSITPDGVGAGLFVSRSDVAAVARLLDDASTTLSIDPGTVDGFLIRARTMIASMLQTDTGGPTRESLSGGLAPWQVRRIKTRIDGRLDATLRVEQLAQSVGLSKSHFARVFRVSFECSPHTYIMQRRVDCAKALLRGTTIPLAQVSLECGLADQAHLCHVFRRYVG
jgi:AraC family transcriptional regulator